MRKHIPRFLKYPIIALYVFLRCLGRGRPAKDIVLNLAGVLPPEGSREIVHGGKVKLLPLRERFGDTGRRFNMAYFVSSGLPFAPHIWLRIYRFFGVRIVWNQNGFAYPALYSQEVVQRVNGLYRSMRLSDYVVYQTEFTRRCADRFLPAYPGPSSVLVNPVDTLHFTPRESPLPSDPFVLIMSANHFESRERMGASLRAVKELHNKGVKAKLIMIGTPEEYADEEIAKIGLEDWVEKKGAFLQKDAPALYQSAHALLHLKYLDPCPTIVLEALACGLPVVGTASGGLPEMVNSRSGILVPIVEDFEKLHYPDPRDVADALLKIYENITEYSLNAREGVLKFDKETWLQRHEEIFKELCRPSQ